MRANAASLAAAWRAALGNCVLRAAESCAQNAMALAPEGDGRRRGRRLKSSFSAAREDRGEVLAGVARVQNPHAAYVEFGTGRRGAATGAGGGYDGDWPGMAAQPYMQPAADMARDAFVRDAAEAIRAAARGA